MRKWRRGSAPKESQMIYLYTSVHVIDIHISALWCLIEVERAKVKRVKRVKLQMLWKLREIGKSISRDCERSRAITEQ